MQTIGFHTSLLLGDLIYALPGIRQAVVSNNCKAVIYLHLDQTWPMADAIMRRNGVTLIQQDFDFIYPLLKSQYYIQDVKIFNDEMVHVDLDDIMGKYARNINVPYGCISRWYFQLWPEMTCDLSKKWIDVDDRIRLVEEGTIVVSRSARSHNPNISYSFLEKYKDRMVFIGHEDEWRSFCNFFPIEHYKVKNFLEMALLINSCSFFIGNQSFPYSIAEGLKVPRILELYNELPHVIPTGEHAYDYYHQACFEFYVNKLIKK